MFETGFSFFDVVCDFIVKGVEILNPRGAGGANSLVDPHMLERGSMAAHHRNPRDRQLVMCCKQFAHGCIGFAFFRYRHDLQLQGTVVHQANNFVFRSFGDDFHPDDHGERERMVDREGFEPSYAAGAGRFTVCWY